MKILQCQSLNYLIYDEKNEKLVEKIATPYTKRVIVDMTDKEYEGFTRRIKLKEEYERNKKNKYGKPNQLSDYIQKMEK